MGYTAYGKMVIIVDHELTCIRDRDSIYKWQGFFEHFWKLKTLQEYVVGKHCLCGNQSNVQHDVVIEVRM